MKINIQKYPAYKDSGVEWLGMIPEHWECIRMKHLFKDVSEKNKPNAELLSVTQNQGVVPRTWVENRMVMPSGALESFKFIKKGDFAISLRSFEGGLEYCHHDGIISPAYTVLKAMRYFESKYYKYLFKSFSFISELQTSVVGIREGKNISYEELCYSFLPIPSLNEQVQLSQFLDSKTSQIDEAIKIKEKQIELLKERRQILIHQAVTRGLNPDVKLKDSGVEWIGEVPEHWGIADLRRFTLEHRQGYYSESGYNESGHRVVRITDLLDENIIDISDSPFYSVNEENRIRYELKKGDFLFQRTGSHKKIGVFNSDEPAIYASYLIRFRFNNKINHNYLLNVLNSEVYTGQLNEQIHGGVNPNIHAENIKICKIIYPPIDEQLKISEFIESISSKTITAISLKEQEILKLKEYKGSLINEVVTGKVRVG